MKRRLPLLIWAFVPVLISNAIAQTGDGYIGIYADSAGTIPCTSVPQPGGTTLYVIGKLAGATAQGITGAEFRVEVTDPDGWVISYSPPDAAIIIGNPIDTDPEDPGNGAGINLSFENCLEPGISGNIALGQITVLNWSGASTQLLVKRHSSPTNHNYFCPLFTSCETPTFPTSCMTLSTEEPCSLSTANKTWSSATSETDPVVFGATVLSSGGGLAIVPLTRRSEYISLVYSPAIQDVVIPPSHKLMKVLQDTTWTQTWTFEAGSSCNSQGWQALDLRHTHSDSVYWSVSADYSEVGNIHGKALILRKSDPCWVTDGYGNDWDQAVRITYQGNTMLCFDYLLDSDGAGDFLSVEADSNCASFNLARYYGTPSMTAASYRDMLFLRSGKQDSTVCLILDDYGGGAHCVYIRFFSDGRYSPEDSATPSTVDTTWTLGAAAVIDNIFASGQGWGFVEDFESTPLDSHIAAINSGEAPFGLWPRLHRDISDNDICTENTSCAWLWTDHTTPTIAQDPSMSWGPGGLVIKNWLDNAVISPWVGLSSPPNDVVLSWREFSANRFLGSRIVLGVAVRSKIGCEKTPWSPEGDNSLTRICGPIGGGGLLCRSSCNFSRWYHLESFTWVTSYENLSQFIPLDADSLQIRFRVADWQWLKSTSSPPIPFNPGPGPFIDRVKLGQVGGTSGPLLVHGPGDTRWQAQDAFPTYFNGTTYVPDGANRFGSCAFSRAEDLNADPDDPQPGVAPGDAIQLGVVDANEVGGITTVGLWYSIVAGPHKGKRVPAKDPARSPSLSLGNGCYADTVDFSTDPLTVYRVFEESFDDEYFRGGDVLRYFWWAKDYLGSVTSSPPGITDDPVDHPLSSVALAESFTGGLWEVSFLPTITWSDSYVARVQAHETGKVSPTTEEIADSEQANCILYVSKVNTERRSTDLQRTSFMYTLDRLGYRDSLGTPMYDVYDVQGFGNTNNDLGSRATESQVSGYALIVHDAGHSNPMQVPLPDGSNDIDRKVDQATWYRNWLDEAYLRGSAPLAATLWIIGEDIVEAIETNPLITGYTKVKLIKKDQAYHPNPEVWGRTSFTFDTGPGSSKTVSFVDDVYALHGGCPDPRDYDAIEPQGGLYDPEARSTHVYRDPATGAYILSEAAVVMRRKDQFNWNTVMMTHPWFDLVSTDTTGTGGLQLAEKILAAVVPPDCGFPDSTTTDTDYPDTETVAPLVTRLLGNYPNPCNPRTTIRFTIAEKARAVIKIFDVAGRYVRTVLDDTMTPGQKSVGWDGLTATGRPVASGIYFVHFEAGDVEDTKKMVVVR